MKVREFITQEIDIDVYDDVCEELGIAFCGPMKLTEAGEKKFAEVLDYEVELVTSGRWTNAIVHVDDNDTKVWKRKLRRAKEFFESMAGYCTVDEWDEWFEEVGA